MRPSGPARPGQLTSLATAGTATRTTTHGSGCPRGPGAEGQRCYDWAWITASLFASLVITPPAGTGSAGIFTPVTNVIESLNARSARPSAAGHFPGEQAALKVLYLVIAPRRRTGQTDRQHARVENRAERADHVLRREDQPELTAITASPTKTQALSHFRW